MTPQSRPDRFETATGRDSLLRLKKKSLLFILVPDLLHAGSESPLYLQLAWAHRSSTTPYEGDLGSRIS